MNNGTKRAAESVKLVGEICLYGSGLCGVGWLARGESTPLMGNGEPVNGRSLTEAAWQAAEALRSAGLDGVVAIYAPGGDCVALARLGNVPTFGSLNWRPAGVGLAISAEQIAAAAR